MSDFKGDFKVDTSAALAALDEAREALLAIEGSTVPTAAWGKSRSSATALLTRELLRVDHMLKRAGVAVMDEYWFVKEPPSTDTSTGRTA